MEQSFLALRVLRRLIIQCDFPNRQQDLQDIWRILNSHFDTMLKVDKYPELQPLQISKLHLNMAKNHPAAFALLPNSIDLVHTYWNIAKTLKLSNPLHPVIGAYGDTDEMSFIEKLTLKALLILRAVDKMVFSPIQTFKYQQAEDKDEKRLAREKMKSELLVESFAQEIMELLVTRFFVFTTRDLKEWEEEPDEWEKTQEGAGEDWEFSVRTCAEKLFLDLIIHYKEALVPHLLEVLGRSGMTTPNY